MAIIPAGTLRLGRQLSQAPKGTPSVEIQNYCRESYLQIGHRRDGEVPGTRSFVNSMALEGR
jgi:hypothetical protein